MTGSSDYIVRLSLNMIVALCDIDSNYQGEDSPRHDHRTLAALDRRELVTHNSKKLTAKGAAYLDMALWERKHNDVGARAAA